MNKDRIFADSNVIITSLLSKKGASYLLLNQPNKFVISNVSKKELERVADKLEIDQNKLQSLVQKRFKTVKLTTDLTKITKDFEDYTSDPKTKNKRGFWHYCSNSCSIFTILKKFGISIPSDAFWWHAGILTLLNILR